MLLDEIEKAHPDVFNILLQIMEDGRLTDSFGRKVDFRNVILIMTSNIGAEVIKNQAGLGFRKTTEEQSYETMKEQLMKVVEKHFRPEFLNRVDGIIVFRALTREDLQKIIFIELDHLKGRLSNYNIKLSLTEEALDFVISKGYDPHFGARPLRRAIENLVEDPLAEELLQGRFIHGATIKVKVEDGKLTFEEIETPAEPALSGG